MQEAQKNLSQERLNFSCKFLGLILPLRVGFSTVLLSSFGYTQDDFSFYSKSVAGWIIRPKPASSNPVLPDKEELPTALDCYLSLLTIIINPAIIVKLLKE